MNGPIHTKNQNAQKIHHFSCHISSVHILFSFFTQNWNISLLNRNKKGFLRNYNKYLVFLFGWVLYNLKGTVFHPFSLLFIFECALTIYQIYPFHGKIISATTFSLNGRMTLFLFCKKMERNHLLSFNVIFSEIDRILSEFCCSFSMIIFMGSAAAIVWRT